MGRGQFIDRDEPDVVACPIISRLGITQAGDDTHRLHAKNKK